MMFLSLSLRPLIFSLTLLGLSSCFATPSDPMDHSPSQQNGKDNPYPCSFDALKNNASFYTPSSNPLKTSIVQALQKQKDSLHFIVFLGTWCGDSKQIIPVFFNYLQEADFNTSTQISLFCVQHGMTMEDAYLPAGIPQTFNVKKVPSIIFFKNGKEITRIIEYGQDKFSAQEQKGIPLWEKALEQALSL